MTSASSLSKRYTKCSNLHLRPGQDRRGNVPRKDDPVMPEEKPPSDNGPATQISFGKYKGKYISEIPTGYLKFITSSFDKRKIRDKAWIEIAEREMLRRGVSRRNIEFTTFAMDNFSLALCRCCQGRVKSACLSAVAATHGISKMMTILFENALNEGAIINSPDKEKRFIASNNGLKWTYDRYGEDDEQAIIEVVNVAISKDGAKKMNALIKRARDGIKDAILSRTIPVIRLQRMLKRRPIG